MKISIPTGENFIRKNWTLTPKQLLLMAMVCPMIWVLNVGGSKKYVVVTAMFAALILLIRPKLRIPENLWLAVPSLWMIVMGWIAAIGEGDVNWNTLQQSVLYLMPLFFVFLAQWLCPKKEMYFWVDLMFVFIGTCVFKYYKGFSWDQFLESDYAFTMGAFAIFYFYFRRYGMTGLALFFMIVAHKRSAALGAVCGIVFLAILGYRADEETDLFTVRRRAFTRRILFLLLLLGCIGYVALCRLGGLNALMELVGINPQGRTSVWAKMSWSYEFSPLWTGTGLGFIGKILPTMKEKDYYRLHNDILVCFIETGAASFVMWILLHAPVWMKKGLHRHSLMIVILFVYTFGIYSCDNVSLYINYMFPLYAMIIALLNDPAGPIQLIFGNGEKGYGKQGELAQNIY